MKAIILNGAILVLLAGMMVTPALAQGGGGHGMGYGRGDDPGDRLEKHVSYLEDGLNLTEDQVKKVEEILTDSRAESMAFRKSNRDATHAEIEGILTDDQKVIFKGMQANMRGRFGGRGSGQGMRQEAFMEELGLTDEQQKQFDALRTSHQAAMKSWKEQNPNASAEDFKAFRDQMHKSGRAAMEGFLTPEQLAKVDEHHKNEAGMGRAMGRRSGAGWMMEQLNLTDDQKSQLGTLREQQCISRRDGFKSILTAAQFEELETLQEARKQRGGRGNEWMGDCWK